MSLASLRVERRDPLLQVVKTSVGTVVSWVLASWLLHEELPILAAIATLLVIQPSVNQSLARGVERSLGVIAGVVLAVVTGLLFGTGSVVVVSAIVVALLIAWALRLAPGSATEIPISAMVVLAIGSESTQYATGRIVETILGAVVGLVVNAAIVPPVLTAPARLSVGRLSSGVASALDRLAASLTSPMDQEDLERVLDDAQALRPVQARALEDIEAAVESLTLNPRAGRNRRALQKDQELFDRLTTLLNRTLGMTRAFHDNYDERLRSEPMVEGISRELRRAAHDVRLMARQIGGASPDPSTTSRRFPGRRGAPTRSDERMTGQIPLRTHDVPVLTAPLRVVQPHPEYWILIGSLLEDLRRIREEIMGQPGV